MIQLDIPTTWADWNRDTEPCPWSMIHHVSPSNFAWLHFSNDNYIHFVPRLWDEDVASEDHIRFLTDRQRSDGMYWGWFRSHTVCGKRCKDLGDVYDVEIGMDKFNACPECWDARC